MLWLMGGGTRARLSGVRCRSVPSITAAVLSRLGETHTSQHTDTSHQYGLPAGHQGRHGEGQATGQRCRPTYVRGRCRRYVEYMGADGVPGGIIREGWGMHASIPTLQCRAEVVGPLGVEGGVGEGAVEGAVVLEVPVVVVAVPQLQLRATALHRLPTRGQET